MLRFLILAVLWAAFRPVSGDTVISTNSTWRLLKGRTEASSPDITVWRTNGFNDSTFETAPAPFSYGENFSYGTFLDDMRNTYNCFFLRQSFMVTNLAEISGIQFGAKVDDGFVVWINGRERLRINMPGQVNSPVTITNLASAATEPVAFVTYPFTRNESFLVSGTNVLAVQIFNTTRNSSDILFDCSLDLILADTNAPSIVAISPAPGSILTNLTEITVTFSETVTGLNADDLNLQGIGAAGLTGSGTTYKFTFSAPQPGLVPVQWTSGHGIIDRAIPPNYFVDHAPGAMWTYTLLDTSPPVLTTLFPTPGATLRVLGQVEVLFSEPVSGVDQADLKINGLPATNLIVQTERAYVFQFPLVATGNATVSWAIGHGISDAAQNSFSGASFNYTVNPSLHFSGLVINEINAANQTGLADEDGEQQDWIELYNGSGATIDLSGWSLSDNADDPGMWSFHPRAIASGQYLVVLASGKDRKSPSGSNRHHTSFKLGNAGEFLGVFSPDSPRQFVSGFSPGFPLQGNDYSYGLAADGTLRYFDRPTPGGPNGTSTINGMVESVHFSTPRGHFTQPFDLVLSCATRGTVIRYTTDGSEPTETGGLIYRSPLNLNKTTLLRASAFRTNLFPSSVDSHSYFFNQSPAILSLPIVSIQTAVSNLTGRTGIIGMSGGTGPPNNAWTPVTTGDYHNPTKSGIAWERPVSMEFILPSDKSGFQIDAGLRVQGSDWTRPRYAANSKFSYRVYFRGDYGPSRLEFPFFTDSVVQSFDQLVLRAGHNDISNPFLRDELMRQLYADMGQVAGHGNFANFFINGVYKGYYNPVERVEEGFLQSWHGGSNSWDIITVGSQAQGGDTAFWNSLRSYANSQDVTQPAVYSEILRRMDVENFIDYLILNTYAATWDWPHNNWRAARERAPGGKFRFYVWDAEGAMGHSGRSPATFNSFSTTDSGLLTSGSEIPTLYRRLRGSEEFRLLWADRVQKHFYNDGPLMDDRITRRFVDMRSQLLGVIPGFDNNILTSWIPRRRAPLLAHYNSYGLFGSSNAPVLSQHGGNVPAGYNLVMRSANDEGTVYFTINGQDPRVMFSGAVAASAVAYSNSLTLGQNVQIKARTYNGTNWSALTEADFTVASRTIPLRFTEINYNPAGSPGCEFVEIQNMGAAPLDLSGMNFDGITFTFPSFSMLDGGARIVLASASNPNAFSSCYPGIKVAGYYTGSLNNGGERLALKNADGGVVTSVTYDNGSGWPAAADGSGASLEIVDLFGNPDDPANWRASVVPGGSPGAANPATSVSAVRINELLADNFSAVNNGGAFPDFIELTNDGQASVNLSGWSLGDVENPRSFVFPPNSTIQANNFLVLWGDAAGTPALGLHLGFSFAKSGETVLLYDARTNLVDAISFGAQLRDYSIGRSKDSWLLNTPTPNAPNVAATVGSAANIVINEFLANPLPGAPDWIELFNNSSLPVALQDTFLSNTSSVHQIKFISFLAPYGFAQLFADELSGPDHLNFKLSPSGGAVVIYDNTGAEVNRINYGSQNENVSRGRLPDAGFNIVDFPGTASPGATNFVTTYSGPLLNEVMARNFTAVTNAFGQTADWIECYNPGSTSFSLSGFSLSVDSTEPGSWRFPTDAIVPAGGYILVWCDAEQAISTNSNHYNTGKNLGGESGSIHLFNPAGQRVNSIDYGFQVKDRSIGRAGNTWRLLVAPSPGRSNGSAALLGPVSGLRINEWSARPAQGPDWFEIYNSSALPVEMSGLFLTDDPKSTGTNEFRIPPLSFIGGRDFVQWIADSQSQDGLNHVNFSLDQLGETIRLYESNGRTIIDSITYGAQNVGVSQGRIPDGESNIFNLPGSSTPSRSNYRLLSGVMISEILSNPPPGQEKYIELQNLTEISISIDGWFLSDQSSRLNKFRIPPGTQIPAKGFALFLESQFNTDGTNDLALDRARGGELWLSEADAEGNLTGFRTRAGFGAAPSGISQGPAATGNRELVLESTPTPGSVNTGARIGPIVIHEFMYHPPEVSGGAGEEFIELRNISGNNINLFDPERPTNSWRLRGAVDFVFPAGITLPSNGYLLVVAFDPVRKPTSLSAFRSAHGVPAGTQVVGPFAGKLDNSGETIELSAPDLPQGTYIPYVTIDQVTYADSAPWPSAVADGDGASLQRRQVSENGNSAANWFAALPTAGRENAAGGISPPSISLSPVGAKKLIYSDLFLRAAAIGPGPVFWQWRFNGAKLDGQTNEFLLLHYLKLEDAGLYDVYALNPGGAAFSTAAQITVVEPPVILAAPPPQITPRGGANTTLLVQAEGTAPLNFQWSYNGVAIQGATGPQLSFTNLVLDQSGSYSLSVTNDYGSTNLNFSLIVHVPPFITRHIQPQTVLQGGTAVFEVEAGPEHPLLPLGYRWIRSGLIYATTTDPFLVLTNVQSSAYLRLEVFNAANPAGILSPQSSVALLTMLEDFDHDGLADAWETLHFGNTSTNDPANAFLDADGDGMSNRDEYVAGTIPTDPTSLLKVLFSATVSGWIEFMGQPGVAYIVQWRTSMEDGAWTDLLAVASRPEARQIEVDIRAFTKNKSGYFRVIIQ